MHKIKKEDTVNIVILVISFIIIYFILTRFNFLYGSVKDWNQQHYIIPEYFRNLFYQTHDLFPDFAFNLGSGENIYNFAYYGLFSPIILISYLLPFISMQQYIIISTIILLILSVILMYFFIKDKYGSKIAFISSFIFLAATPLTFHSHRHIMFMNYMPFLIMGFMGVDRYFKSKKKTLLIISVFLMIMTSFYFSVSGIVSLVIYGVFCFLKKYDKVTVKNFLNSGINFLRPIIVGVLLSCLLIVPTFYALLKGRGSGSSINLLSLFLPNFNLKNLLYASYSLGLSSIALFSLVDNFNNKKEYKFLTIVLAIFLIFPICSYILNGTLYVETKAFIPFLPLFILLISNTINNLFYSKINLKIMITVFIACFCTLVSPSHVLVLLIELSVMLLTIYLVNKKKSYKYFYLLLLPLLFILCISFNLGDNLVREKDNDISNTQELVDEITTNDSSFYRTSIYDKSLNSVNRIYNMNYYTTSVYSSSSSMNLKDTYYNRLGNEVFHRTYGMMSGVNNLFYNLYMGNKYIISSKFNSSFYEEISDNVYKSNYALPVGYVSRNVMSLKEYNSLSYPDNIYAYLKYTIIDDDSIVSNYKSSVDEIDLDYDIISSDITYDLKDNHLVFETDDVSTVKLNINNDLEDKILIISFDMNYQEECHVGDTYITINGVKNKLSCDDWKYDNNNDTFKYVLSGKNINHLKIDISEGSFDISNISFYTIDYSDIYSIVDDVDSFNIDKYLTKGDTIIGTIDVKESGYFNISIPKDDGFSVYVDGEEVEIISVDVNFMGFFLEEGSHTIRIEYHSPYKSLGIVLSIIGLILFIVEGGIMLSIIELIGFIKEEINSPKTKIGKLYSKYREIVNYLIVGGLTTVVSLGVKWGLLFTVLSADNALELQLAIIISWICAVLFAYVSNRIFVFNSKNKNILKELVQFFGARVLTLVMEMVIMWFFVTLLKLNSDTWVMIWTFITQVLITIFNYIFSKMFVFKKRDKRIK